MAAMNVPACARADNTRLLVKISKVRETFGERGMLALFEILVRMQCNKEYRPSREDFLAIIHGKEAA